MKFFTVFTCAFLGTLQLHAQFEILGELQTWHKVTIDFSGPEVSETDEVIPFSDYRLQVTFSKGDVSYSVPGYFAADGDAGGTSATSGSVWRVHFAPDSPGQWTFSAAFTTGTNVAINGGGSPVSPINGLSGQFSISNSNKSGRDFRGKGRLLYVGERYLRFSGSGEYFLKIGADAPETFLAYEDFDGTPGPNLKSWSAHVQDWNSGDPTWKSGKGKGMIGALNYLAEEGQNAFSFLTMNINGDGKNVWPYVDNSTFDRFDCSKLDQWEIIFEHADKMGLYLHFKTQETENDQLLNNGALGRERKLYYRELIARFSHHLALNWNLGEENTQTTQQRKDMAQFFFDEDPYHNHVVLHTYPGQQSSVYDPLLGTASKLTGVSVQTDAGNVHRDTRKWVIDSENAGVPWVVANDEQGSANVGVKPDAGFEGVASDNHDDIRHTVLWGNFLAGGAGVEYYFGYGFPQSDLTCENYRSRDKMWDYNRYGHAFMTGQVPFWNMENRNDLIGNNTNSNDRYCLAEVGKYYLIYLPAGGTTNLDLGNSNMQFYVRWFDPRNGGNLLTGSVASVSGPGTKSVGTAPNSSDKDWVVWVTLDPTSCVAAGQPCDDGDASTFNDLTDGECGCSGQPCPIQGTICDDGNSNTINDQEDGFCNCIGTDPNSPEIWLETECAIVGSEWSSHSDASVSGGVYMMPPNKTNTNTAPSQAKDLLTFKFSISEAGIYKVFARTLTSADGDDSFWVRINQGSWIRWNKINFPYSESGFTWNQVGEWTNGDQSSPLTFDLAAGLNQIDFAWREPGIKFDKLFVSKNVVPQNVGSPGTNCAPCPENYVGMNALTGDVILSTIYQTEMDLHSSQRISSSGLSINYHANESIVLLPGFSFNLNNTLNIQIKGCNE